MAPAFKNVGEKSTAKNYHPYRIVGRPEKM